MGQVGGVNSGVGFCEREEGDFSCFVWFVEVLFSGEHLGSIGSVTELEGRFRVRFASFLFLFFR